MIYVFLMSLRMYLEENVAEANEVKVIRDGLSLQDTVKPFLTVQYLAENDELISAGRTSYEEIYRFQVGIYAATYSGRLHLEEPVKTLLREPIRVYSESGLATDTSFTCDVSAFTPMVGAEPTSDTNSNFGFFDVAISIYRNNGESTFTQ